MQEWLKTFYIKESVDKDKDVVLFLKTQVLTHPNSWDQFMTEIWFTILTAGYNKTNSY